MESWVNFVAEFLDNLWKNHRGKIIGSLVGLVAGLLLVTLGFWRTILILLMLFLGLWVGGKLDRGEDPFLWLNRLLEKFSR